MSIQLAYTTRRILMMLQEIHWFVWLRTLIRRIKSYYSVTWNIGKLIITNRSRRDYHRRLTSYSIILSCWYNYCWCWKFDDGSILLHWYYYWWSCVDYGRNKSEPSWYYYCRNWSLIWLFLRSEYNDDSSLEANNNSSFEANNNSSFKAIGKSSFEAVGTRTGLPNCWTGWQTMVCSLELVIRLRANYFSTSENNPPYCRNIIENLVVILYQY